MVSTVTGAVRLTVSVTTWPAPRSAAGDDAVTEATAGMVVSICSVPGGVTSAPLRLAALPAPSRMVALSSALPVIASAAVFCPLATV